jgi:hypothetical protein
MLKTAAWLVGIGSSALVAAWGQSLPQGMAPSAQCAASASEARSPGAAAKLAQNQQVAIRYAVKFYTATMAEMIDPLSLDYVEHAASARRFNELNHVSSRDGARLLYETLSRLRGGGPPFGPDPYGTLSPTHLGNPAYMVLTEGNCVMVVAQQFRPDPQHSGKPYEVLVFDAFRVNDQGKITDHWDDTIIDAASPVLREPVSKMHFPAAKLPIYGAANTPTH